MLFELLRDKSCKHELFCGALTAKPSSPTENHQHPHNFFNLYVKHIFIKSGGN